jgi:predicted component of type VI protein secretion system
MFKMTFHTGTLGGETLNVSTERIVIGRSQQDCDVWLNDDGVSREHCSIEQRDDGIYIVDLDSRNGTWVNRERVTECRLESGDELRIGPAKITFEAIKSAPQRHESAISERRVLSLASLFAFMRGCYGAICLGLAIAIGIVVLLLALLPNPQPRETEQPSAFIPPVSDGFARNDSLTQPPPPAQRQIPIDDNPIPPREENVLAALANRARQPAAVAPAPIQNIIPAAPQGVRIVTGFDGSKPREIRKVGENHFSFALDKSEDNYFLLKIEGAAGKKVRVDIRVPVAAAWASVNPVYSYTKELDDFVAFLSEEAAEQQPPQRAQNPAPAPQARRVSPLLGQLARQRAGGGGALLPDTSGQEWHFIRTAGLKGAGVFSFEQTFEKDSVYVAMRVPYTYGYNEKFMELLEETGGAKVITVGKSKEGRNLRLVKISNGEDAEKRQPCVLIYAREHGYEADSSFVAQGALLFLLSDEPQAREIRSKFTFLIIPMLDPDGAFAGAYENLTDSFSMGDKAPEAIAYATWFKQWVDEVKRLDVAINLHNFISTKGTHIECPLMEPKSGRLQECQALHRFVTKELKDYNVAQNPWEQSYANFRLGGWLRRCYGTLHMPYEINSQSPSKHLTIAYLRQVGEGFVRAVTNYLDSGNAETLFDSIAKMRVQRLENWSKYGHKLEDSHALAAEGHVLRAFEMETIQRKPKTQ